MTKFRIILVLLMLLIFNSIFAYKPGVLGFQIGTGFGGEGLHRVNGGAYAGKNVTMDGNVARYNFKASPVYFSVGANVGRFKHTEWDIELESVTYTSSVLNYDRLLDAKLHFTNFNIGIKYLPLSEPLMQGKLTPYIKGSLYNSIYTMESTENTNVKNPNAVIIDESNVDYVPMLGLHVGANYMYTKHLGGYAQIGYGFEFCQFGLVLQL
ncbi:MAG: hypothetical protein PHV20_04890 [Bacteroidales bacterium]|nr:hypothetical protein [Bacteroidales bacterium]